MKDGRVVIGTPRATKWDGCALRRLTNQARRLLGPAKPQARGVRLRGDQNAGGRMDLDNRAWSQGEELSTNHTGPGFG